ncbi:MAG: T9SS type A sorting domain-containing protein [Chitinophagales bacterium]
MRFKSTFCIIVTLILCSNSARSNTDAVYQLANNCYTFYRIQDGQTFPANENVSNSKFFMKPSALGEFMIYHSSNKLLSLSNSNVVLHDLKPTHFKKYIIWEPEEVDSNRFVFRNASNGKYIQWNWWSWIPGVPDYIVKPQRDQATVFELILSDDCSEFPEAELNAVGTLHTGPNPDGTVWGITDLHDHSESQHFGGGYMYSGLSFSPYGIVDALGTCKSEHGNLGTWDFMGLAAGNSAKPHSCGASIPNPNALTDFIFNHHSEGYPDFKSWPTGPDPSHQKNYYQWLNRARYGGLRTITMFSVDNYAASKVFEVLVPVLRLVSPELHLPYPSILSGTESHQRTYERVMSLIDYVDAQEGGPGKGWLKLATSPAQAREEANKGNLCIILGMEIPDLFDCIDNSPTDPVCDRAYISERLDYYYDQGVRVIFPLHHIDTKLGGSKTFGMATELAQLLYNGTLREWEPCEASGGWGSYTPFLQSQMLGLPDFFSEIIIQIITGFDVDLPDLEPDQGYCNGRGLTESGVILVEEMVKRGMMFDLDHCSRPMLEDIVDILDRYNYPFILSHNRNTGDLGEFVYSRGGMMASSLEASTIGSQLPCSFHTSGDIFDQAITAMDLSETFTGLRAAAMTTDFFGTLAACAGRFSEYITCDHIEDPALWEASKISYPFTSFDGQFVFDKQKTGNKEFDFNEDGFAHIGMLPDYVRDIMNQGFEMEDVAAFHRSTEAFIRLWEQCELGAGLYEGPDKRNMAVASDADLYTHSISNEIDDAILQKEIYKAVIDHPLFANIPKSSIIDALYGNNGIDDNLSDTDVMESGDHVAVSVYPTLIHDQLTVESPLESDILITIVNASGQIVYKEYFKTIRYQKIEGLSNLSPGSYFITLTNTSGNIEGSFQLIKQ